MDEVDIIDKGNEFLKVFQSGQELVKQLVTETAQLRQQTAFLQDRLETSQNETKVLSDHAQSLESQKRDLEHKRGELETTISELLASAAEASQQSRTEIAGLREGNETLRREIEGIQLELQSRNQELETRKAELNTARSELEAAQAELDTRNATLNERDRALAKAERRIAESSSQQAALSSHLDELLKHSESLEHQSRDHEQRADSFESRYKTAVAGIESLKAELSQLQEQHEKTSIESTRLQTALTESERKNDSLANLYLAAFALHRTLDWSEVIQALGEILTNQIGLASYVISLANDSGLETIASRGSAPDRLSLEGSIGEAFIGGSAVYMNPSDAETGEPFAVVPLTTNDNTVGVIALYQMLPQKSTLTSGDQELLGLLSRLAATALVGSRLNLQARNGRSVLRSFLTRFRSHNREQAS